MEKYVPVVVNYSKARKSQTVPDQSMSIDEIVKRFVRGIPVDVYQREAVYVDQTEEDLEKLSRMDFHEKAEYAQQVAERARMLRDHMAEAVQRGKEAREKAEDEAASASASTGEAGKKVASATRKKGAPAPSA